MRILQITPEFPPIGYGKSTHVYELIRNLRELGHSIYIIVVSEDYLRFRNDITQNIGLFSLEKKSLITTGPNLFLLIRKICNKFDIDIIHTHLAFFNYFSLPSKVCKRTPIVYTNHGSEFLVNWKFINQNFSLFKKIKSSILASAYLRIPNAIIATSRNLTILTKKFNSNVFYIPNGIDLEKFKPNSTNKKNNLILLTVCRLVENKGIFYLLNSFRQLCSEFSNVKLIIIGDGNERENIKKYIINNNLNKKIILKGFVQNIELPRYYRMTDVFILPSISESTNISCLEAMASGLPIVSSKIDGIKELVKNEKNGFLVHPTDEEELFAKIRELCLDKKLRDKMGMKSRELAKNFSWAKNVKRIEEIYLDLL